MTWPSLPSGPTSCPLNTTYVAPALPARSVTCRPLNVAACPGAKMRPVPGTTAPSTMASSQDSVPRICTVTTAIVKATVTLRDSTISAPVGGRATMRIVCAPAGTLMDSANRPSAETVKGFPFTVTAAPAGARPATGTGMFVYVAPFVGRSRAIAAAPGDGLAAADSDRAARLIHLPRRVEDLDVDMVGARLQRHARAEGPIGGGPHVRDRVAAGKHTDRQAAVRHGPAADRVLGDLHDRVAGRLVDLEARQHGERRELVVEVREEEGDGGQDRDRHEHRRREDHGPPHDRPHGLERPRRIRRPALALELLDQRVRIELQVLGVVPQKALRVHRAGQGLVIAVLERAQELFPDPRFLRRLLDREPHSLTLRAQCLTEARHYSVVPSAPRRGGGAP